jgi:hypothetical protein
VARPTGFEPVAFGSGEPANWRQRPSLARRILPDSLTAIQHFLTSLQKHAVAYTAISGRRRTVGILGIDEQFSPLGLVSSA